LSRWSWHSHSRGREQATVDTQIRSGDETGPVAGEEGNGLGDFTRLGDVATPVDRVCCASPDEPAVEALRRAGTPSSATMVLVVDDGNVVGTVTGEDVRRAVEHAALRGPAERSTP